MSCVLSEDRERQDRIPSVCQTVQALAQEWLTLRASRGTYTFSGEEVGNDGLGFD